MKLFKQRIAQLIWKICKISPRMGNFVMDLLGDKLYEKVMWYQAGKF